MVRDIPLSKIAHADHKHFNVKRRSKKLTFADQILGGSNYGNAIASTANAQTFFQTGVCGIKAWGVNVFYFEAFDETWKPASQGDNGVSSDETHWGAMTADRSVKFSLNC